MKHMRQSVDSFHSLFVHSLRDLFDAEHQIIRALPKMLKKTEDQRLRDTMEEHLRRTEEQGKRLEVVFMSLDEKPRKIPCAGMKGLIAEGKEALSDMPESVRDAAILMALQKIEHYEISSYGALSEYAKLMGHQKAFELLEQTLEEEKEADRHLTKIAEESVNPKAM